MNELDTYLGSGVIEAYCLGNLSAAAALEVSSMAAKHPAVKAAIEETIGLLEKYPQSPEPRVELKMQVLDFLDKYLIPTTIDLQNPPLIHRYSDSNAWNQALRNVEPDFLEPGLSVRVLQESEDIVLSVVWLSDKLVEQKHATEEFQESFFILEGACECDFEGKIVRFSAGDYFDIPPNTNHIIRNISEGLNYVKGLVQRRRAA